MNYKIFQICFEKNQISEVDKLLTPFDNTSNEKPELREFHSFNRIIDEGLANDLDAWGVFGPRWQNKIRHKASVIKDAIDNNHGYDVYIFNHARVQNALTVNVWEQGEYWHPGIKQVVHSAFVAGGYDTNVIDTIMTDSVCYCSYFVATKTFWLEYIAFVNDIKEKLEALTGDNAKIYHGSANYFRDSNLNMFPFIIERLFSTFLHIKKYKIYSQPYDYGLYQNQINDFSKVLHSLYGIKCMIVKQQSQELFEHWNLLRLYFAKAHPNLFNLDG